MSIVLFLLFEGSASDKFFLKNLEETDIMSWFTILLQKKEVHKHSIWIILSFKTNFNGTTSIILVTDSLLSKVLIEIFSDLKVVNFSYFLSLSLT